MTILADHQADLASVDGESRPVQLPAYSETDEHSNAGFEMVDAPQSPAQGTHMTAEQEKAYLASKEQPEAAKNVQWNTSAQVLEPLGAEHQVIPPTSSNIYERPLGDSTSTPVLSRGLQVPTSRRKVSSGFPYPDMLSNYGISREEWGAFALEITKAAQLSSKDWSVMAGASVATFVASGVFIGWLGLIPAFVVGQQLRRSAEHKNLRAARDVGDLEAKLLRWNQTTFAPKGFLVRLDLPGDESSDLDQMDVYTPKKWDRKCGGGRHACAGSRNREGRWAKKAEKRAERSKRNTAKKGRIVIVPIVGGNRVVSASSTMVGENVDQNPLSISEKGNYKGAFLEV